MSIATYAEFSRDFRAVLRRVIKENTLYTISAEANGRKFLVFDVSIYSEDIDGHKPRFEVSSRDMKDNTAFYLNTTRDLMANLLIVVHGKGKSSYLVEARPGALRFVATRHGVGLKEYRAIVLGGGLSDLIGGDPVVVRQKYRRRIKELNTEAAHNQGSINQLERQAKAAERWRAESLGAISRLKAQNLEMANIGRARDTRIAQLETIMRENGLEPPGYKKNPGTAEYRHDHLLRR